MSAQSDLIVEFCGAWSRLDPAELANFFTEDGVYHNMPAGPIQGRAKTEEFIRAFPSTWTETTWKIFFRGNVDPESLDDITRQRYRFAMQNITKVMLEIYAQTHKTGFSPETWETQGCTLVNRIFATSGGEWFWAAYRDNYPADFRRAVDRILQLPSAPDKSS